MSVSLIVAMAENRVIGIKNDLPWHIPEDLKRFKALTLGKPVIMGRKTFDSIYARIKKPLPDRPNIVISRSGFTHAGVDVYADLQTALNESKAKYPAQEIMIIGGASVYEQALPFVDTIHLTIIHKDIEGDAWFPEIDKDHFTETTREKHDGSPAFSFVTLARKS